MLKRSISLALVTSLLLINAPAAPAHTALVSSNPKSNAMLTKSPTSISLTFNEELIKISGKSASKISLANSKGAVIKLPEPNLLKGVISVKIPVLKPDKYKVTYRVVSADGHPVSGSFNFWVH